MQNSLINNKLIFCYSTNLYLYNFIFCREHTESRQNIYPQNPYYPPLYFPQKPLRDPIPQFNPPSRPFNTGYQPPNGLMDILDSVAANDELQCVSKIFCEMTSGSWQNRKPAQQNFVNLDSILT